MSRRSEISHKPNNTEFNLSLFEHALKDPASKNLILQLLSANQKNVFELFKPAGGQLNSPVKRVKRKEHCESPTALLRRRELEKINRPESAQSHTSEQSTQSSTSGSSSTIPFERILKNVVAYVEINSNGNDRSGGAKALLKSMGAIVSEKFRREVTHVIFKDGLYTTYQRAKLLKVHLVSVLWLEATRRNGVKAQENSYPALGTKNYDLNVSLICSQMQKDYEEVIREEIKKTLESGTPLPSTKTLVDTRRKTMGSSSKSFDTSSQLLASQSSRNNEVSTILSKFQGKSISKKPRPSSMILQEDSPLGSTDEDLSRISKRVQSDLLDSSSDTFRPTSLTLGQNEESDSDSECGMINGDFSQKESVMGFNHHGIALPESDKGFSSYMDITCNENGDSFIINKPGSTNRTSNSTTNMDLATPIEGNILQSLKGSFLNPLSGPTSKNQNRKRDSEKVSTPNELSKTLKRKSKSTFRRKKVENNMCFTPPLKNENAISEGDFYMMKTPKLKVPKGKLPKPVNILAEENDKENVTEEENGVNIEDVMSSLRIRVDFKGQSSSPKNSSETTKKSTGTSMSSLRLSKSSLEDLGLSNVPSSRISSEKQNVDIELNSEPHEENRELNESSQNAPLLSTPFVTERKKRNNRKSVKADLMDSFNGCVDNLEVPSKTPVRRSSRRESSVLNKEKQKFQEELDNKKMFHDKNKEVELSASKERSRTSTPRPARKFASLTPSKSDVFVSPFVNSRPRRKSTLRALEERKTDCSPESEDVSGDGCIRRPSRITRGKSTSTLKQTEEQELSPDIHDKRSAVEESEEQSVAEANELSNILEEDETSELNNSASKSMQPTVLLQDVLVSPPTGRTRGKTMLQQENCVDSSVSIYNKVTECSPPKKIKYGEDNEEAETDKIETDRKIRRRTMRGIPKPKNEKDQSASNCDSKKEDPGSRNGEMTRKVSRSKSASEIHESSNVRKSRRIRKLYDPDQFESGDQIHENLGVDDQEERKTIRQEKFLKVNVKSQNNWLSGNVLMSEKAMEFLTKTSPDNMNTLFKKPESVLEKLGIDKEKRNLRKKSSIINNSADEQVDLAEEFVNKKVKGTSKEIEATQNTPRTRKSMRNLTQKALTTGNRKRRSTMEFVPKPLNLPKVRTVLNLDQKPTIVCTKMHKADVQMFNQIVRKLGKFEVEDEVSQRTTHLVVGEPKRTVNMLRALSRGCWILKQEWLFSSLEEGKWLPEEKYEATEFSLAVQQCRLRRQAFGPSYRMNIFLDCGMIFVAKSTMPRCSDIRELITLCEGKLTKIPDNAKIAVGAYLDDCDCVNEYWILDSITSGKLKPLEEYAITAQTLKAKSPFV